MAKNFNFGATKVAEMSEDIRDEKIEQKPAAKAAQEAAQEVTQEIAQETTLQPVSASSVPEQKPEAQEEQNTRQETESPASKALAAIKDKTATNGIVVNVPMEDYFQLLILKKTQKKTLKELALQAIHEFVERNQVI